MSTLAQRAQWLPCRPCRCQTRPVTRPESADLAQRYARGDEHQRLCLWLQHREARGELDMIEAEYKPRTVHLRLRRKLHRLLGIPWVG